MVYALKDKKRFLFSCVSKTLEQFDEKVDRAYWHWYSCQKKGTDPAKEDFLKGFFQVEITIKKLSI